MKIMSKYIIKDWADNLMNPHAMATNYSTMKSNTGLSIMQLLQISDFIKSSKVVDTFDSFDHAEEFLSIVLGNEYNEDRQEYYIEEE